GRDRESTGDVEAEVPAAHRRERVSPRLQEWRREGHARLQGSTGHEALDENGRGREVIPGRPGDAAGGEVCREPLLSPEFLRKLEQLELVSRKVRAGRMKGDRLSKRKGRGSEFADFR